MNRRVLLIGGSGFIGSHLADRLLALHCRVRVLDRCLERFRPPLTEVEHVLGDCTDTDTLSSALRDCDVAIHLAHVGVPVGGALPMSEEVVHSMSAFAHLLECVKESSVEKFIFFSSGGAAYGVPDMLPVPEQYAGRPVSPYGVAKLSMEHYLHMFSCQRDLPYVVIRPSNPYGPRQNYLGTQGVIPIFMYRILTNQKVSIWGDGTQLKDYLYVADLAEAVTALIDSDVRNTVLNVGSGQGASLREIVTAIEATCDRRADVVLVESKKQDVPEIVLSCEKIREKIGWEVSTSLHDGIVRVRDWMAPML